MMRSMLGKMCFAAIMGMFVAATALPGEADAAGKNIASGVVDEDYGHITWSIDSNGFLLVEGTGNAAENGMYFSELPWGPYCEQITSAKLNVKGMEKAQWLFRQCTNLTSVDLSGFDTSSVTNMIGMFEGCYNLKSVDLSGFDTGNLTNMSGMFLDCVSLESVDMSSFDTSNVTDMSLMFEGCENLKSVDLSGFDTSNVTDMSSVFNFCGSLESVDLSGFDTSNVTDMSAMFELCSSLKKLDLSGFDTSGVTDMSFMFADCSGLEELNFGGFIISEETDVMDFFRNCDSLKKIVTPAVCDVNLSLESKGDMVWMAPYGSASNKILLKDSCDTVLYKVEKLSKKFSDVYNDWYSDYVNFVYHNNLMTGIGGTTRFEPNSNITKAQVAQVLYNMAGKPECADKQVFGDLSDVLDYNWYSDAVAWAYFHGIITGDLTTMMFYPDADVTREQLAVMMHRYMKYYQGYDTSKASDFAGLINADKVSDWAYEAMSWAVGTSIIGGIDMEGVMDLAPQGNATRAQIATIIQRICKEYAIEVNTTKDIL